MDNAKASAKSKRAHSLNAKRAHSTKHHQHQAKDPKSTPKSISNPLPSNWDRYSQEEEEVEGHGAPNNPKALDVVAPKSKGADFGYLISQAQSDAAARGPQPSPIPGSFDDVLSDFCQGVGSLLSVKGSSLLSWGEDDNFIVDDGATSSFEASFLSLDLQALAAKLENIDVSKRLFIERDLLSEELFIEESKEIKPVGSVDVETSQTTVSARSLDKMTDVVASVSPSSENSPAVHDHHLTMEKESEVRPFPPFASQTDRPDPMLFHQNGAGEPLASKSQLNAPAGLKDILRPEAAIAETELDTLLNSINETNDTKLSSFEAASAEADLDMLLDSFGETKFLDSVGTGGAPGDDDRGAQQVSPASFSSGSLASTSIQRPIQVPESSKFTSTTGALDDAIDDLLSEIPKLNNQDHASLSIQRSIQVPDSSNYTSTTGALDDAIDDLLSEMPELSNQDHASRCSPEKMTQGGLPSCSSSKALDDFDSWLDTLE